MTSVRSSTQPPEDMEPRPTRVAALRARRQVAYLMLLTVVTGLLGTGISIGYTRSTAVRTEHKAREDVQRWCQLLTGLDERYQKLPSPPPGSSDTAVKQYNDSVDFQKKVHDIVQAYDCAKVVK
jgi:hypothetical protein